MVDIYIHSIRSNCKISINPIRANTAVKRLRMHELFVRAELSARTKTEEKYISERLHKALEKRVNEITRGKHKNFVLTQGRYSEILYFQLFSYFLCFFSVALTLKFYTLISICYVFVFPLGLPAKRFENVSRINHN